VRFTRTRYRRNAVVPVAVPLPETNAKRPPKRSMKWLDLAATRMRTGSGAAVLGILELVVGKKAARYVVTEAPTAWDGRGFRLLKFDGDAGTDEAERSYDVFCAGPDHSCPCKGHARYGTCKHADALLALVRLGKLAAAAPPPTRRTGASDPPPRVRQSRTGPDAKE
jgi:hypothetical protein